ncbi:MAG: 16S rRNA (cytidine(1402)-2'-O)-methyltransferase [Trichodesmium sp. St16_bin4-tuft]|nr:16S rRNA (cytidine(1402)-2'-O)-methyltransferase [Trichodesmium sp. MAG_R01]MDE5070827.1 16S rRNA (cytidine(1402)-2'-O)-methyltransferase [Trichodesmium sp. St5_bin8]MDE5077450.1 16S rRNA (cytidine(1402)-2'-O)-methyltransferase [Trichodesmium sp. St2_bin6]MDE5100467.1 16S rRNA (cytidine(1402)-2'-O)-methyltransferase [Trichodesmium sp. St16_bin4-tuft]
MSEVNSATLYIVGTPIGNLEDTTFRAIQTLQKVDLIAAEDTRHTSKLLQHFHIQTPQLSYHQHNEQSRIPELIEKLNQGKTIALVTDAGMPGISDPGYELVKACVEENISIVPIPGVTASITALCASGLPTNKFIFIGFLPTKIKLREEQLEKLSNLLETIVLYESPYRLLQTLEDLGKILGENRKIVLARELTKLHEEFWRGTVGEAVIHYQSNQPKGEFTLVITGSEPELPVLSEDTIKQELQELFAQGISRSQASRQLAQKINLSRRTIYQIALKI